MKNLKLALVAVCTLLGTSIFAQTTGQFTTTVNWTNSDGSQARSMVMYVPTNYSASTSYSLVIGFHGLGDDPANYMNSTNSVRNFATDAYFGNVIVACPSEGSSNTSWILGEEDFGIITAIKNTVSGTYNIDGSRVFAQGFSYGGKSAYLHGLEEADEIRGIIAFSPAFYGDEDLDNACVSSNCVAYHHDFDYTKAPDVFVCTGAGSSEFELTPLDQSDFGTATPADVFLALAEYAATKINNNGGDAIFIENTATVQYQHSLPPLNITKQCWDHVNQSISTAGLDDIADAKEIIVYPNPSTGLFNVNFGIGHMETLHIYDIQGREIKKFSKNDYSKNEINIDLSAVKNGIYFLNILTQDGEFISEKIKIFK